MGKGGALKQTLDKAKAIEKLMRMKNELEAGEKFKGRAYLIKNITKRVQFLTKYAASILNEEG